MSPTSLDHRAGHLSDVGLAATLDVVLAVCTLVAVMAAAANLLARTWHLSSTPGPRTRTATERGNPEGVPGGPFGCP